MRVLPAIEVEEEEEEEELMLILWLRFMFRGDWLLERGTEWFVRPDTTSPNIVKNKILKKNEKIMKNKVKNILRRNEKLMKSKVM